MTAPVVTVPADMPVKQAARVLQAHGIAAAPVVTADCLVGMVSELDLLWGDLPADPRAHAMRTAAAPGRARTVADVMTRDVVALPVDTDAADLLGHMRSAGVRSIPIVEGDRLVGIVARRDLLRAFVRADAEIARDVEEQLRECLPAAEAWDVRVSEGIVRLTSLSEAGEAQRALDVAVTVPGVLHAQVEAPAPASS